MNALARFAVFAFSLFVCSAAHADNFSFSGNVTFDQTYATFSAPFSTGTDTGYFAPFSNGSVQYYLGTIPYMVGVLNGQQVTFSVTDANGNVLTYTNTSNTPSQSFNASGDLVAMLNESGYYTINGGQQQAGFFDVLLNGTSSTGAASVVSFSGTGGLVNPTVSSVSALGVAPEPSSILLMGTGLLGMAMLLRARSRSNENLL